MSFFKNGNVNNNGSFSPTPETIQKFTATANQTVFNLSGSYETGKNRLQVFVGGVPQFAPENFAETSTKSFTLKQGVPVGTQVVAIYF